jgi:hypothetical protein
MGRYKIQLALSSNIEVSSIVVSFSELYLDLDPLFFQ